MDPRIISKKEPLGKGFFVNVSKNHTFGTDAVLLADFAASKKVGSHCDLGAGCGIISLLLLRDEKTARSVGVEISEEAFVKIFDINLFGVYRINKAFVSMMGEGGRIVITSSELAPLDPLPFTGLYAVTKGAVEKYADSLRMELNLHGISVSVLRPGAVRTGMLSASTTALEKFCEKTERYACNAARFRRIVDSVETRNVPPEKIADTAFKALTAKRPKFTYNINRNPLLRLLNILPKRMQVWIIAKILK